MSQLWFSSSMSSLSKLDLEIGLPVFWPRFVSLYYFLSLSILGTFYTFLLFPPISLSLLNSIQLSEFWCFSLHVMFREILSKDHCLFFLLLIKNGLTGRDITMYITPLWFSTFLLTSESGSLFFSSFCIKHLPLSWVFYQSWCCLRVS